MSRSFRIAIFVLLALAVALPASAADKGKGKGKGKHVVKATTELEAGQPLRVDVDGDLHACTEWDCWLWIGERKADEALYLVEVETDGSWIAYAKEEEKKDEEDEEDKKDKDAEEEDVSVVGATGVKVLLEKLPEEECEKYALAKEDDKGKGRAGGAGKGDTSEGGGAATEAAPAWTDLPVLTQEQRDKCQRRNGPAGKYTVEKARGTVAAEGAGRHLLVPADLLPTGDFEVSTNGFWGAQVDGKQIGTADKTGVIRVRR